MLDSAGEAARSNLFSIYKQNARKRGLTFTLPRETFYKLTKSNCFYCGEIPSKIHKHHYYKNQFRYYTYNGVDRVASNEGYTEDNCVSCCFQCNKAKWTLSMDEFASYIQRTYEYMLEFGFFEG